MHPAIIVLAFLATASPTTASTAFTHQVPKRWSHIRPTPTQLKVKTSETIEEIEQESEQLRQEIKELKSEALRRLRALEENLGIVSDVTGGASNAKKDAESSLSPVDTIEEEGMLPAPPQIVIKSSGTTKKKSVGDLLDESVWKVSLSIGREPGTWMPKTWGTSGQRLNLSFQAEFNPSQLYERDDFFRGGYTNAKILRVLDGKVTLGPSLTEGQRVYNVKNGGWQVTEGDGPLGTDLLRFYIELDDEISHKGSDVYVPKGRVYCSCGYFPFTNNNRKGNEPTVKESYTKELANIEDEIQRLREKKDEIKNPFSLDGIKISREIGRLRRKAELVAGKLNFSSIIEPDQSLLRFTKDKEVGLTKEGGVCCKVEKGPMMVEYHILGRFGIANDNSSESK